MQSPELKEPQESPPAEHDEPASEELAELYQQPLSVRDRHLGVMALGRERGSW